MMTRLIIGIRNAALAAARAEGKVEGYREADIEWRSHLLSARAAGYDQGRAEGAAEERGKVAAYLRRPVFTLAFENDSIRADVIARIERGDHLAD